MNKLKSVVLYLSFILMFLIVILVIISNVGQKLTNIVSGSLVSISKRLIGCEKRDTCTQVLLPCNFFSEIHVSEQTTKMPNNEVTETIQTFC